MPELNGQISKQQTQKITPNFMLQFNSILWDICVCALTGPKMPVLVLSCKYPRRMVFTVCLYDIVPPLPLFLSRVFFCIYLFIYSTSCYNSCLSTFALPFKQRISITPLSPLKYWNHLQYCWHVSYNAFLCALQRDGQRGLYVMKINLIIIIIFLMFAFNIVK